MSNHEYIIYKIFYDSPTGEFIAYLGRTKQPINSRLNGHFFGKLMHKKLDVLQVSHIEIAECKTEADMFLYEIYYINKYKPPINADDKSREQLTIILPELEFETLHNEALMEKWRDKIRHENEFAKNFQPEDLADWI
ncbi:MAG: GIY-YIG nuclease family protein [Ruminococcus flavefaciens]|nr:GIY-YIG nuclease family protein [Ruminococcus flavefaciens]